MADSIPELSANAGRFRGSLDDYDQFRPAPPALLAEVLERDASIARPALVVDLGCGTGLSTRFWSDKARRVVGIDPNPEMLAVAQAKAPPNTVHTLGFSHATGLESGAVDAVTCCQSLHWMVPDETIAEVARILRPGGAWLIADYDLPRIHADIDTEIDACIQKAKAKSAQLNLHREEKQWTGDQRQRIESSGKFRFAREFLTHAMDTGDATRLLGLVRSLGTVQMPLQHCKNDMELGLDRLEYIARQQMRGASLPWKWTYRIILAVK